MAINIEITSCTRFTLKDCHDGNILYKIEFGEVVLEFTSYLAILELISVLGKAL